LLVIFSLWFIGANLWLAWAENQTIDEAAHITAGYSYITAKDFRLNPEHPPLLKELSALPLLALNVKDVKDLSGWNSGDEWQAGKEFVYSSPTSPRVIIFTARLMPIVVAFILGLLILALASYFTNRSWGLLAFGFYCFDPNILAHSHLVTTDIAAALGFLAALAALFYWANRPSLKRLALVGLAIGIALSLKFSLILVLPLALLILAASTFYFEKLKISTLKRFWLLTKRLLFICLIILGMVWLFYGFEVVKPSSSAALSGDLAKDNAIFSRLQNFYVPLYSYLRGLGRVIVHSQATDSPTPVYLLGNYSTGSWYYFFVAMLVKTPLAIMAAALLALGVGIKQMSNWLKRRQAITKPSFYILCLALFVAIYLISSMFVAINIGWRHILPIYPMLYILIAVALFKLGQWPILGKLKLTALAIALWLGLAVSMGLQWPYNLSYSNEAWPVINHQTNWPRLTDSNLDWGQDVYRLINYANSNPNITFYYDLFSNADITAINPLTNLIPAGQIFDKTSCHVVATGTLATSYQIVYNDRDDDLACLRGVAPDSTIGSSILLFNQ
jgi:hypothetical protein